MVKRKFSDCDPYAAEKHFNMVAMRVHGKEESGADKFWMGLSHFLPGGGAEFEATPCQKIYFVLEGEVVVTDADGNNYKLGKYESICIRPNEGRSVLNESILPASMLVIINYPD